MARAKAAPLAWPESVAQYPRTRVSSGKRAGDDDAAHLEATVLVRWILVVAACGSIPSSARADVDVAVHGGIVAGSYTLKVGGVDAGSTGTGVRPSVALDETYRVSGKVAVGLSQRLSFGVAEDVNGDGATELDLVVRLMVGRTHSNRTFMYGFLDLGYSRLFMPEASGDLMPSGFILGGGVGFRFPLHGRIFAGMAAGAQLGGQGGELSDGSEYTLSTTLYHAEALVGVRL